MQILNSIVSVRTTTSESMSLKMEILLIDIDFPIL